jgi:hypothetical protein
MKESNVESLASYSGPESCGGGGNITAEALTGGSAGVVWSPEIGGNVSSADRLIARGRQHAGKRQGELVSDSAGSETHGMHGHDLRGNRETLPPTLGDCTWVRAPNPEGVLV